MEICGRFWLQGTKVHNEESESCLSCTRYTYCPYLCFYQILSNYFKPLSSYKVHMNLDKKFVHGRWLEKEQNNCPSCMWHSYLTWYMPLSNTCNMKLLETRKWTIKTKSKKGHNSAKVWQMITKIKLDLYFKWYKLLQTLTEINASFQKLLSRKEKCDDDDDEASDANWQHDPHVSAMLRRRHKKNH